MFYIVGITKTCERLAVCVSEKQASKFIETLPDHEQGIYYIDDCRDTVTLDEQKLHRALELSVCYSPGAIRDSVDSYEDDHPVRVAVENASDDELLDVSYMIVGSDPTWSDFHDNIDMCVREKFNVND